MNNLYSDISTDDEEEERIQETIYSDISSDSNEIDNNEMVIVINAIEVIEPLIMVEIRFFFYLVKIKFIFKYKFI